MVLNYLNNVYYGQEHAHTSFHSAHSTEQDFTGLFQQKDKQYYNALD